MQSANMRVCFALLLLNVARCSAEIFPISDTSYPHVVISDPSSMPVAWHKKSIAFRLLHSSAVRVNARGIRFVPSTHSLIISTTPPALGLNNAPKNRWRSTPCLPARDSLCHLRSRVAADAQFQSRVFPNYPNVVYITQKDASILPSDVAHVLMSGSPDVSTCPETSSGRTVVPPLRAKNAAPMHDVSLCNLMGMAADVVYVPAEGMLHVLGDPVGIPALLLLGVLIVFMMIIMGHNLQAVLSDAISAYSASSVQAGTDPQPQSKAGIINDSSSEALQDPDDNHRWTVVGMVTVCVLAHFCTAFNTSEGPPNAWWLERVLDNVFSFSAFITQEDRDTFIFTTLYILYYCARVEVQTLHSGMRVCVCCTRSL